MYCKNCGKEVNDNAYICLSCGVKLKEEPPIAVKEETPTAIKSETPSINQAASTVRAWKAIDIVNISVLSVLFVLMVIGFTFYLIRGTGFYGNILSSGSYSYYGYLVGKIYEVFSIFISSLTSAFIVSAVVSLFSIKQTKFTALNKISLIFACFQIFAAVILGFVCILVVK
ncbi:MAG: zinc ribbon domain-containing protein [Clostridiales bacterium]|jgi:hypothetical protein|nr:zinc ribbon domain-containing protein [Clostridiales bacterium]